MLTLPAWLHPEKLRDNWQAGPWDRVIQARGWRFWAEGGDADGVCAGRSLLSEALHWGASRFVRGMRLRTR